MFDFHKAITAFHNDMVTLPQSVRTEMKERRNSNRKRLDTGLGNNSEQKPFKSITQGSYAMRTMVQDEDNDYDIDDGIYFKKSQLKTAQGNDKTAHAVRQMVCDALSDDRFNDLPEVKTNCVRVNYGAGYHVDIPIYRTEEDDSDPELAGADWALSCARDVKKWFDGQSQNTENSKQLRRITRLVKKFAKSRKSWKGNLPSGFALTILVCECFHSCLSRDDLSLYETLQKIHARLKIDLEIWHPTTPNTLVNSGDDDAKTRNLRDKLSEKLLALEEIVINGECTEDKAATAWGKFFDTECFTEFVSRTSKSIAVAESSFAPLALGNAPVTPPQYWDGEAGINIIRQQGKEALNTLPYHLPHVVKPRWKQIASLLTINIKATYISSNNQKVDFCSGEIIPPEAALRFSASVNNGFAPPENDYIVKWQVVNTCKEAFAKDCMRGGFEESNSHARRNERSLFCGIHWIEAFLIRKRDSALCGRSGRFFVVISSKKLS